MAGRIEFDIAKFSISPSFHRKIHFSPLNKNLSIIAERYKSKVTLLLQPDLGLYIQTLALLQK